MILKPERAGVQIRPDGLLTLRTCVADISRPESTSLATAPTLAGRMGSKILGVVTGCGDSSRWLSRFWGGFGIFSTDWINQVTPVHQIEI